MNIVQLSEKSAAERPRATKGSLDGMVRLDRGGFLMGSESRHAIREDGEGPVRRVTLDPFYISRYAVTNEQFGDFVRRTGYRTEAEQLGWSFVFRNHVPKQVESSPMPGLAWWRSVPGASWQAPEGPGSSVSDRPHHPATHISWNDAQRYCAFAGMRLPTEAEWEYASRGGLEQRDYPWGDDLMVKGRHRCNIWQGAFPDRDLGDDGFTSTAPVDAFEPNGYGLYNPVGNVWEWCADVFDSNWHGTSAAQWNPAGPPSGTARVIRGGSFLCHRSYCFRYRNSARTRNDPDSSTANLGFRVTRDL